MKFLIYDLKNKFQRDFGVGQDTNRGRGGQDLTLYSKLTTIVLIIDYNIINTNFIKKMDILKIGKSKTRVKILRHFFVNPDKKYYLRELERILGVSVGNIRRELLDLKKTGLFEARQEGKQVYYFLNKKSPIFHEFKKIVAKTIGAESVLKEKLMQLHGVDFAFIYGSIAREEEDEFSDIDFFVIGSINEDDLLKSIQEVEKELSREINYVIFSAKDIKEGIKKNNVFLKDVIKGKKIFLIGSENDLEKIIGGRKNSEKKY